MDNKTTEFRIIEQIALSPQPISAFEISKVFGENNYSHVHKVCKNLIEDCVIESENSINKRNAPKKVFRLTMRGFCLFVLHAELFKKHGWGTEYSEEELQNLNSFFERWKYLHAGIEIFYSLFIKYQIPEEGYKFSHAGEIIDAFGCVIGKAFHTDMYLWKKKEESGDLSPTPDPLAYKRFFWDYFVKNLLDLPRKTTHDISYDDIVEIFRSNLTNENSLAMNTLVDELESRKIDGEEASRCYKKYF
jgi:hypothetical protein